MLHNIQFTLCIPLWIPATKSVQIFYLLSPTRVPCSRSLAPDGSEQFHVVCLKYIDSQSIANSLVISQPCWATNNHSLWTFYFSFRVSGYGTYGIKYVCPEVDVVALLAARASWGVIIGLMVRMVPMRRRLLPLSPVDLSIPEERPLRAL